MENPPHSDRGCYMVSSFVAASDMVPRSIILKYWWGSGKLCSSTKFGGVGTKSHGWSRLDKHDLSLIEEQRIDALYWIPYFTCCSYKMYCTSNMEGVKRTTTETNMTSPTLETRSGDKKRRRSQQHPDWVKGGQHSLNIHRTISYEEAHDSFRVASPPRPLRPSSILNVIVKSCQKRPLKFQTLTDPYDVS